MIKKKLTQEHKDKIAEANRIALKRFYENNPDYRNSGMYKKGKEKVWTEKEKEKISGEKSYLWKGGISRLTAKKVCIEAGKDLTTCQICKEKVRTLIHHCDGNRENNNPFNLGIVCYFCHNAIHDNPNRKKTQFKKGHEVSDEIRMKIGQANTKHGRYAGGILV